MAVAQEPPSTTTTGPPFPGVLPTVTPQSGCPAVTETGILCSTCVVPACIEFSTVTQVCGCPTPVATVYLNWPCGGEEACAGAGCTTAFQVEGLSGPCASTTTGDESGGSAPDTTTASVPVTTSAPEASTPGGTSGPETTGFTTPQPSSNGTVPGPSSSGPTSVAENAAGRMRVPLLGWW
ncbi:predicted protein [Verticillium alfalfae VaMs.102]|uniref:Predicted protein n=1 Tax=Verticillium alfalfae (strain VaMs.102 / ATCC MYA-4576 / FGSC 10136) TaxID=526221 RepID=C9SSJ8_VERA1|nr:predicted protein [Verticillium alfalfae VaMs.102]EEY21763.1 predicted protein [Verticillium alfalfae VaMs.102]